MNRTAPSPTLPRRVVEAVRTVVGDASCALHEPRFAGNEWSYVKECLDTTFVSSVGKFVDRFEHDLCEVTGAPYAVCVVNGTAALHVALILAGVRPGDEVLVPDLTFVATPNAVTYCGAIPHFAECDETTLGLSARAMRDHLHRIAEMRDGRCVNRETGRTLSAVLPMHAFGHPADIAGIMRVAAEFNLAVIEDAAESIGSTVAGRHTGTFGLLGTLSFNGNKTITTGGGGAIITSDGALARDAKHLTTTAKVAHRWEYSHDRIGYNYRMPNINAALGCAQLERLPAFIDSKRRLHALYQAAFAGIPEVRVITEPPGCRSNYWLQGVLLDENAAPARDAVLEATHAAGYMTRPAWTLMHRLAPYASCPRMPVPVAESIERRLLNLPSSAFLGQAAVA